MLIFPAECGQGDRLMHPSFSDHFKRRSENTKHTFGNNKDLILVRMVIFIWLVMGKIGSIFNIFINLLDFPYF